MYAYYETKASRLLTYNRKMGKTVSLILPHIHMMFQLRGYGFLVGYNNFVGSLQVVSQ